MLIYILYKNKLKLLSVIIKQVSFLMFDKKHKRYFKTKLMFLVGNLYSFSLNCFHIGKASDPTLQTHRVISHFTLSSHHAVVTE